MAMSIFVSVEDRDGELLADVFDIENIQRHFGSVEMSTCLRFISVELDASFNSLQTVALLGELQVVGRKALTTAERLELERIIEVCEIASNNNNAYIKFYGDKG